MRAIDRWAIEVQGVSGLDLMERAGAGVVRVVERLAPDGAVAVVCGKGNNGGDGLVVARLLRDAGREVAVVCAASPQEFSGDARENLERLPGNAPVQLFGGGAGDGVRSGAASRQGAKASAVEGPDPLAGPFARASIIVDALLGTGFQGEPRGAIADAIDAVNAVHAPVVSVDVPSGVDASTGVVSGAAIDAAATVTFHAAKPGLWIRPGKAHAGELEVLDIGIPRGAPGAATIGLIAPSVLEQLPRRDASSTKFSSGHVFIVGGSRGLTGAPLMAARASMRAGAGYVTACVPASLQGILASAGPAELMTHGLPDEDGGLTAAGVAGVLGYARRGGAIALGPGLGRSEGATAFALALAREATVALVLDADGLNAHVGRLRDLSDRDAPTVLTPHAGELGRLLGRDSAEIDRKRLHCVVAAAELARSVVVLKGDDTLIADPSGRVAVSPGASPALATAGTGDVLTGVIAALLAQGLDAFAAACAGVSMHAAAGRLAARRQGSADSVVASDVIAALGAVRANAGDCGRQGENGGGDGRSGRGGSAAGSDSS